MTESPAAQAAPDGSTPSGPAPAQTQRGSDPYADYQNPPPRTRPGEAPPPAPRTPPSPAPPGPDRSGARDGDDRSSDTRSFIDRLFGRRTPGDQPDGAPDPGKEPASRPDAPGQQPAPAPPQQQQGQERQAPPLTERAREVAQYLTGLTAGELEALAQEDGPFARAVQSEIDRRVARENRQRDEQGRFVRQQRVQGLRQEARQARQTDVYKAAELEEQADQLQQQEVFVRGLVENYDRVSIDPIMQALPEADRAPLLAAVPDGLEGRAQLVRAALARLEQVWRADEARKVRGGAQRRQQNAERRLQRADEDGEPDLVPGIGRGRNGAPTMNDWLRQQMGK